MRIAIEDDREAGRMFDVIERNEECVGTLLRKLVRGGLFGGLSEDSQADHAEVVRMLAENGHLFARLFGRQIGGPPKPDVLQGKAKPVTHADLLHQTQADVHLIAADDKSAMARHAARKPAPTLHRALFG